MKIVSFHLLFLLSLLGTVFLFACSKEQVLQKGEEGTDDSVTNTPEEKPKVTKVSTQQRSKSEVLELAAQYFQIVDPEGSKLRSTRLEDLSMEYILSSDQKLRGVGKNSGNNFADTLLYIVNRANQNGFCIISGDKRLPDLLAVVEKGHLDPKNVDPQSGIAVFLSRLPTFFTIHRDRNPFYPRYPDPSPFQPVDTIRDHGWHEYARTPNYVPVRWGQGVPYNNSAPRINGQPTRAGCVAVATAQLLAAHKYPTWYKGMHLDWDLLIKSDVHNAEFQRQVAYLIRGIGNDLGNMWGIDGTSANEKDIPPVLRSLGYHNVPDCSSYRLSDIVYSLDRKRPVLLSGFSEINSIWLIWEKISYFSGGHVWICDGYLEQEHIVDGYRSVGDPDNPYYKYWCEKEYRYLLHCNWGWNGKDNGYFFSEVFDSDNPVISDQKHRGGTPYYYQFELSNLTNIYR